MARGLIHKPTNTYYIPWGVQEQCGITQFLVYSDNEWHWVNADEFKPYTMKNEEVLY